MAGQQDGWTKDERHQVGQVACSSYSRPHPPHQGRVLVQMIFGSNQDDTQSGHDNGSGTTYRPSLDGNADALPLPHPPQVSKFAKLKRKLFPSRKRQHPTRLPPLVTSPVSMKEEADTVESTAVPDPVTKLLGSIDALAAPNQKVVETTSSVLLPSLPIEEDDVDADATLSLMDQTIQELGEWRRQQDAKSKEYLEKMEASVPEYTPRASEDLTRVQEEYESKIRDCEKNSEALLGSLRRTSSRMGKRDGPRCNIARALAPTSSDDVEDASPRPNDTVGFLQNDILDLGIRDRNAELQEACLQDLTGASTDLDVQLAAMEMYTSDLDGLLARFGRSDDAKSDAVKA